MNWRGWVVAGVVVALVLTGFGTLGYFFGYPFPEGYAYGLPAAFAVVGWVVVAVVLFGMFVGLGFRALEWTTGEPFIPASVTEWFKRVVLRWKKHASKDAVLPPAEPKTNMSGGVVSAGGVVMSSLKPGEVVVPAGQISTAQLNASINASVSRMMSTYANPVPASAASEEFSGIGFAAGTVRGARSWSVDKFGRLIGVTYPQVWTPGENHATCRRSALWELSVNGARYTIPPADESDSKSVTHSMDDCGHGFYAYYDSSNDYGKPARVSGVVEGYGEAIIGTRGFRAMKARILAITFGDDVSPAQRALVSRNYPDVVVVDSFAEMVERFPPDADGMEYGPDKDDDFWVREA